MSASWKLNFNGYDLPNGFYPVSDEGEEDIAAQELPRRPGAITQTGRVRPCQLSIMGGWGATDLPSWNAQRDALVANLTGTGDLYLGRDDLYFKSAQYLHDIVSTQENGRLWAVQGQLQVVFQAALYPEMFDTVSNTPTLTTTGGTINYSSTQGSADTWPTWSVTVNAGGTGKITLANTTTGETCILAKPDGTNFASSDVIVVCGLPGAMVATLNGMTLPGLFDRRIPHLKKGNNVITLSDSGTLTLSSLTCSYPGRWK